MVWNLMRPTIVREGAIVPMYRLVLNTTAIPNSVSYQISMLDTYRVIFEINVDTYRFAALRYRYCVSPIFIEVVRIIDPPLAALLHTQAEEERTLMSSEM